MQEEMVFAINILQEEEMGRIVLQEGETGRNFWQKRGSRRGIFCQKGKEFLQEGETGFFPRRGNGDEFPQEKEMERNIYERKRE